MIMTSGAEFKYPNYAAEEHGTWHLLYQKQMELLPSRACEEHMTGLRKLCFTSDRIPRLADVDAALRTTTGWSITRVEGLVQEREFFQLLAQRRFPSTDFIRKREELNYTPAPDMFHDLFGHAAMITNKDFADFFQAMGKAGLNANEAQLKEVQRLYWFTVEFGLIESKPGERRIYGSGILSSPGEVVHCLTDRVKTHLFDVPKVINQEYDIWHMQNELFVIESFEQLKEEFIRYGKSQKLL
jgi:phenylalanine-4-hydroxylase